MNSVYPFDICPAYQSTAEELVRKIITIPQIRRGNSVDGQLLTLDLYPEAKQTSITAASETLGNSVIYLLKSDDLL